MISSCGWIIIIGVILLVIVIWYLNKNNDQPLPNDGVVSNIIGGPVLQKSNSPMANVSDNIVDELVTQYSDVSDQYDIGPDGYLSGFDQNGQFDGYLQKKQLNMDKTEMPYSDDVSDDRSFVHKKKCFSRRTPEDINDLFDINKMMPQEIENGWFDVEPLQSTKKIRGTHMIHPKVHMGINTVGNSMRNATHDIRGDIPNPKIPVSPFNNSTIEPDTNIRGLCQ